MGVLPIHPASSAYFFSLHPRGGGGQLKNGSRLLLDRQTDARIVKCTKKLNTHSLPRRPLNPRKKSYTKIDDFSFLHTTTDASAAYRKVQRGFFPLFPARLRNPANYVITPFPSSFLLRKGKKICIASDHSARRGGYFFFFFPLPLCANGGRCHISPNPPKAGEVFANLYKGVGGEPRKQKSPLPSH